MKTCPQNNKCRKPYKQGYLLYFHRSEDFQKITSSSEMGVHHSKDQKDHLLRIQERNRNLNFGFKFSFFSTLHHGQRHTYSQTVQVGEDYPEQCSHSCILFMHNRRISTVFVIHGVLKKLNLPGASQSCASQFFRVCFSSKVFQSGTGGIHYLGLIVGDQFLMLYDTYQMGSVKFFFVIINLKQES